MHSLGNIEQFNKSYIVGYQVLISLNAEHACK